MKKILSTLILLSLIIIQPACMAVDISPLAITREQQALKSELKKHYSGYEYNITNTGDTRLNIVNAQIQNGTDGNVAYNVVDYSAGKSIGVLWAAMGPLGLFTLGIAWVVGAVATPIVWVCANHKDKKIRNESLSYDDNVPLGYIEPQENISVLTLIPLGTKPQLKITILDEKTKEYKTINY